MKIRLIPLTTILLSLIISFSSRVKQSGGSLHTTSMNMGKCCKDDNTLSVTGSSTVSLPSNIIKLSFTIETKDLEATNSLEMNSRIGDRIDNLLLQEFGIPEKNITTVNYQIYPKYIDVYNETSRTSQQVFDGYVVSNQIQVTLGDKETTVNLMDRIINTGVNIIDRIEFDVDNEMINSARTSLITAAVKDAYDKANLIAISSDVRIIDIKSITFDPLSLFPPPQYTSLYRVGAMESAQAQVIYTSQKEITTSINVVFIISK